MKNIVLGVTGGVAAYKAVTLARLLQDSGFEVRVVMTENAKKFIAPLTFQACTAHRVYSDLIDVKTENSMAHIDLARWADLILVAPATANLIAKCANGFADDLLSTLCIASHARLMFAPAMNGEMWKHPAVQENIATLVAHGVKILGPDEGIMACGDFGVGRMLAPEAISAVVLQQSMPDEFWCKQSILITAGSTHEAIDPIRFLGNKSSGKMGFALAQAARSLGAKVTLISGPTDLPFPNGVNGVRVRSAQDMYDAVMSNVTDADVFIGAAAVANYRMAHAFAHKMKSNNDSLNLSLVKNPDIISTVAKLPEKPFVVGFAAETQDVIAAAVGKMQRKNMDMIVANQVGEGIAMGVDTNQVTCIDRLGVQTSFAQMTKVELAPKLLTCIRDALCKQQEQQDE